MVVTAVSSDECTSIYPAHQPVGFRTTLCETEKHDGCARSRWRRTFSFDGYGCPTLALPALRKRLDANRRRRLPANTPRRIRRLLMPSRWSGRETRRRVDSLRRRLCQQASPCGNPPIGSVQRNSISHIDSLHHGPDRVTAVSSVFATGCRERVAAAA